MALYRRKKIFVTENKTKYVWCYLYKKNTDLNDFYKKYCEERGMKWAKVAGVSTHYVKTRGREVSNETGLVILSMDRIGAAIVAHEFTHACFWAYKHNLRKKQYPLVIKNMVEEEKILHGQFEAVRSFWKWYYKIEKEWQQS